MWQLFMNGGSMSMSSFKRENVDEIDHPAKVSSLISRSKYNVESGHETSTSAPTKILFSERALWKWHKMVVVPTNAPEQHKNISLV